MNKLLTSITFSIMFILQMNAQNNLPHVASGKIIRIDSFHSKYIAPRIIDIWLPDGYPGMKKYAVLYMHDGQMLFDAEITWNKQSWNINEAASALARSRDFIIVGIWNSGKDRHPDYFPQKPFELLSQRDKDTVTAQLQSAGRIEGIFKPVSDQYLAFIVKELKPYIDKHFSVYTNRENTYISGSSMGGLVSIYAICEYPDIFGGAACLSTHWTGTYTLDNNPVPHSIITYLSKHLPAPANHKIYFDCGDQTLDTLYPGIQRSVDRLMRKKGYTKNNWMTRYFPGENHSESAWKKRVEIPLRFLFEN